MMGALYPKPKERYERWRLNENSPLYSSVAFLFIASPHLVTGSRVRESGPFSIASTPQNFTPTVSFRPDLGRYAMYLPGVDTQKVLFTPASRMYSSGGPISVLATWRFDGSTQDGGAHLGGIFGDILINARNSAYSSWCVMVTAWTGSALYQNRALLTTFEDRWNTTATASLPNTHPVLVHNLLEYNNLYTGTYAVPLGSVSLGAWESQTGSYELKGWIADFAIFKTLLSKSELFMLSEPDNHDYRLGGVPLLLPERPRFWSVSPIDSTITRKVPWHLMIQGAT